MLQIENLVNEAQDFDSRVILSFTIVNRMISSFQRRSVARSQQPEEEQKSARLLAGRPEQLLENVAASSESERGSMRLSKS